MTEPETETESGPSAAIIESQLAAVTTTEEKGGGEVEEEEEEEIEVEAAAEEEEDEAEDEGEQQEQEEDVPEEEAVVEEEAEEQQPLSGKEHQSAAARAKVIAQVQETKEQQQVEIVSNDNQEGGFISKKVAKEEGGKKEDEKTRQDGHKKVEEKKIEVTKVEAKKVESKKVVDKKISVGKVVAAPPAVAEQKQVEMRDRLEDVDAEEEEEVEEEEEEELEVEEEVLEEKEEEEEEEEEQEEEEEEQEQQLQLQQVQSKDEKMEEEEEEEEEEDDAGEEDELNERDGSPEEQLAFTRALKAFFKERRMDYKAPKFYGEELNVLKLWRAVTSLGGYDQVTAGKLWRKVGEQFQPPKTCTTLSWSFRGFYEKALLEYERYQSGVSYPAGSQPDGTISGADSQAAMSPNTPSSQPSSTPASGSGRARRDAATRAMHGWHAQRLGNGDLGDPIIKERTVPSKKEKQLKNLVGTKRKETVSLVERAVKVARAKGSKGSRSLSLDEVPANKAVVPIPNKSSGIAKKGPKPERKRDVSKVNNMEPMRGLKLVITDDGPPADWVKINAYRTSEGYEIYALVPGLAREEVRIQCEEGGRVVICGSPEQPNNPWGVTAFRKVVNLPSKIDAHHTSAVVTLYGQLFVRVPFAHAFQ